MKFIVFSFLLLFSGFVLAKVEVYLVTVSELNVRLAPNLAAKISHVMKQGEIVELEAEVEQYSKSDKNE